MLQALKRTTAIDERKLPAGTMLYFVEFESYSSKFIAYGINKDFMAIGEFDENGKIDPWGDAGYFPGCMVRLEVTDISDTTRRTLASIRNEYGEHLPDPPVMTLDQSKKKL